MTYELEHVSAALVDEAAEEALVEADAGAGYGRGARILSLGIATTGLVTTQFCTGVQDAALSAEQNAVGARAFCSPVKL